MDSPEATLETSYVRRAGSNYDSGMLPDHRPQCPPLLEQDSVEAPGLHDVEDLVSSAASK